MIQRESKLILLSPNGDISVDICGVLFAVLLVTLNFTVHRPVEISLQSKQT